MKTFSTIENWLTTNPSKEEKEKVLNLIGKLEVRKTRQEVYALRHQHNKLNRIIKSMNAAEIAVPKEIESQTEVLASKIKELEKVLPVPQKRNSKK